MRARRLQHATAVDQMHTPNPARFHHLGGTPDVGIAQEVAGVLHTEGCSGLLSPAAASGGSAKSGASPLSI
jgi:hypothetical protein